MPTNIASQIETLEARIKADVERLAVLKRTPDRNTRIAGHPGEPYYSNDLMVRVSFTGDRDGNTFAVCIPTEEYKRVRVPGSDYRSSRRMWKYTYERATGSAPTLRSFHGMLRVLDGYGRTVTKVEVIQDGRVSRIYNHAV